MHAISRIVIKQIGNMLCESFLMLFGRLDGIKRYVIDILQDVVSLFSKGKQKI